MKKNIRLFLILLFLGFLIWENKINATNDLSEFAKVTNFEVQRNNVDDNWIWEDYVNNLVIDWEINITNGQTIKDNDMLIIPHNLSAYFQQGENDRNIDFRLNNIEVKYSNGSIIGYVSLTSSNIEFRATSNIDKLNLTSLNSQIKTGIRVWIYGGLAKEYENYNTHIMTFGDKTNEKIFNKNYKFTKIKTGVAETWINNFKKYGKNDIYNSNKGRWAFDFNRSYFEMIKKGESYHNQNRTQDMLIVDTLLKGNNIIEKTFSFEIVPPRYIDEKGNRYGAKPESAYNVIDYFNQVFQKNNETLNEFINRVKQGNLQYGVYTDLEDIETIIVYIKTGEPITWDKLVQSRGYIDFVDYTKSTKVPDVLKNDFITYHSYNKSAFAWSIQVKTLQENIATDATVNNIATYSYTTPSNENRIENKSSDVQIFSFSSATAAGVANSVSLVNVDAKDGTNYLSASEFELYKYIDNSWQFQTKKTTDTSGVVYVSGLGVGKYKFVHKEAPTGYNKATTIYKNDSSVEVADFSVVSGETKGRVIYAFTDITRYKITTSAVNGTITPLNPTVVHGENQTITYVPDSNHKLKSVRVDGVIQDNDVYNTSYTFNNVNDSHNIEVEYEMKTYKIATSVINGTINPANSIIKHGSSQTINYAPKTGYKLKSIKVDGIKQNITKYASSYIFNNVKAHHNIEVEFEIETYQIKTVVSNGVISSTSLVKYGSSKTIQYSATKDYKLVSIKVDGIKQNITKYTSSYTFNNIKAVHIIEVNYSPIYVISANNIFINLDDAKMIISDVELIALANARAWEKSDKSVKGTVKVAGTTFNKLAGSYMITFECNEDSEAQITKGIEVADSIIKKDDEDTDQHNIRTILNNDHFNREKIIEKEKFLPSKTLINTIYDQMKNEIDSQQDINYYFYIRIAFLNIMVFILFIIPYLVAAYIIKKIKDSFKSISEL